MTRKDYKLIARGINFAWRAKLSSKEGQEAIVRAATELSIVLQADNDRFDVDRFMTACLDASE